MTKISLKRDAVLGYKEIIISGHSGYAEEDSDIICAYISSSSELLMGLLIDEFQADIETRIEPENAYVSIKVLPNANNFGKADIIASCMRGFLRQMEDVSEQFPKFVSIRIA